MQHVVNEHGEWAVIDPDSPDTRVFTERNGERLDVAEWQRYKAFCNDLARAGNAEAIRLIENVLSILADEECQEHELITQHGEDFALCLRASFVLRAGWLDRLEADVSDYLEYEGRNEFRKLGERGQAAIDRMRKLYRFAHRGRRGKGRVHPDDREWGL